MGRGKEGATGLCLIMEPHHPKLEHVPRSSCCTPLCPFAPEPEGSPPEDVSQGSDSCIPHLLSLGAVCVLHDAPCTVRLFHVCLHAHLGGASWRVVRSLPMVTAMHASHAALCAALRVSPHPPPRRLLRCMCMRLLTQRPLWPLCGMAREVRRVPVQQVPVQWWSRLGRRLLAVPASCRGDASSSSGPAGARVGCTCAGWIGGGRLSAPPWAHCSCLWMGPLAHPLFAADLASFGSPAAVLMCLPPLRLHSAWLRTDICIERRRWGCRRGRTGRAWPLSPAHASLPSISSSWPAPRPVLAVWPASRCSGTERWPASRC